MKAIKLIIVLCIMFSFAVNNVTAQGHKPYYVGTYIWELKGETFPCIDETLSGNLTWISSYSDLEMIWDRTNGVLIGDITGDEYKFHSIDSYVGPWTSNTVPFQSTFKTMIWHENKLVGTSHIVANGTLSTSGEPPFIRFVKGGDWECK